MAKRKTPEEEKERLLLMKEFDLSHKHGKYIAGVDEAGRGPLAGPVVAATVILDDDVIIEGINDSKKISEKKRDILFDIIKEKAKAYCVYMVDEKEIDSINILQATFKAMRNAVSGLSLVPDFVLIDGDKSPGIDIPHEPIIKGDAKSMSIAAASILAKVTRDRFMVEMSKKYPGYGFERHKGYGTAAHYSAIKDKGICEIHRKTFLKKILEG